MALFSLLINQVDIYSVTNRPGPGGGYTRVPVLAVSAAPCSIQPASANRVLAHAKEGQVITHTLYFQQDFGIVVGWELHVTGANPARVFFVRAGVRDSAGRGVVFEVDCEERL